MELLYHGFREMSIDISSKTGFREVYFHPYHFIFIFRRNLSAHLLSQHLCDRETEPGRLCGGSLHSVEAVKETPYLDLVKLGCMIGKCDLSIFI